MMKQLRGNASLSTILSVVVLALLVTILIQLSKLPFPPLSYHERHFNNISTLSRRDWQYGEDAPPCKAIFQKLKTNRLLCGLYGSKHSCAQDVKHVAESIGLGKVWMFSQFGQDAYMYINHFNRLNRRGVYLDVASNHPIRLSNSYFYDRCLGWKGICVEGNPMYYEATFRERSCQLVPTCAGKTDGQEVEFALRGELGGVMGDSYKFGGNSSSRTLMKERCVSVQTLLNRNAIRRVDFLSLDVEGHEYEVLQGIDWNSVQIDVISVEVTKSFDEVKSFLERVGYRRLLVGKHGDNSPVGKTFLGMDAIYVHPNVRFGHPQ